MGEVGSEMWFGFEEFGVYMAGHQPLVGCHGILLLVANEPHQICKALQSEDMLS